MNRTLVADGGHSQENGFAGVCGFVVLSIFLMAGSGTVTAAESASKPVLALSLNRSAAVTARKGWPFVLELTLMHPQAFASPTNSILIASTGNVWSAALRIEIRDAQGQLQSWPLYLRQSPDSSLELDGQFLGRLQWLLSPAETGELTAGNYELRAILDTTETSVAGAWKGTARSVPVSLDLGEPVAAPDAIEFEDQQKLFARYALMLGDRDLALSNIDVLINQYPTNIGGLTYKAFLLADQGDRVGALALCDQALQQVAVQNPDPQEPPEVLLRLQHDLIDQLVLAGPSVIRGRYVFYNNSYFSANAPAAVGSDDGAIAADKSPLLPGQTATFANYTSYSRGINGIIVDIANLQSVPTTSDFAFKVGNDNNPSAWATAPAPSAIVVRSGGGVDGSDRVSLVWADNAIQNRWLQVTVGATPTTGLESPDVFYFGNAIGDAGNSLTDAKVNATDEILARNNSRASGQAPVDFPYDYNRDGKVNATDEIIARNHATSSLTALRLLNAPPEISGTANSAGASASRQLAAASSPPVIHAVRIEGDGRLHIRFGGMSGHIYVVEDVENLARPGWVKLVPQPALSQSGNGYEFVVDLERGNPMRFYRVVMR